MDICPIYDADYYYLLWVSEELGEAIACFDLDDRRGAVAAVTSAAKWRNRLEIDDDAMARADEWAAAVLKRVCSTSTPNA